MKTHTTFLDVHEHAATQLSVRQALPLHRGHGQELQVGPFQHGKSEFC